MINSNARQFNFRRLPGMHLLRGAAMAEYLPIIAIGMLSAGIGFQRYGGVMAEHMAEMAAQVSSNYYQGWFYPEGTSGLAPMGGESTRPNAGAPGGWGTPSDPFPASSGLGGGSSIHGSPVDPTTGDPINPPGGGGGGGGGGGWGDPFFPPGGDPQQCGIPGGGGDPFPFPPVGSNNTSLGNPIDFGNGNKFQTEVDYQHFYSAPLVFARFYNSLQTNNAMSLGHGWRHSYQRSIELATDTNSNNATPRRASVVRDDGAVFVFTQSSQGDGSVWLAQGVVDQLQSTDTGWRYTTVNKQVETYNSDGRLTRIDFASGVSHTLEYQGDNLVSVIDSRGPQLTLRYKDQWLVRVVLPNEEALRFQYSEQGNLQAYQRVPNSGWAQLSAVFDASTATYHYENTQFSHALTGLSDAEGKRFATWGYDSLGRANLSEHGQGVERYAIEYRDDGTVAATNAAGLVTVYHLENARPGYRRLVSIDGQATPTCPQIRKDHRYDAQGFLALSVDAEGNAVKWQRNDRGLVTEEQNGLTSQKGQWLPLEGASRVTRQWHASRPLITQEIYSSFHQGEWQAYKQWDFTYNDAGRITQRTATDLTPFTAEQPYSTYGDQRTWAYSYTVNDQYVNQLESVSVNGPRAARDDGTDDITTEYFNPQGLLAKVENALGHVTEITGYNSAGLPTSATLPSGAKTLLSYNAQNLVTDITRQSADGAQSEHTQLAYLKNGLLQKLTLADGSWQAFEYNDARQMVGITNNWGDAITVVPSAVSGAWTEQVVYNSQGHVVHKGERALDSLGRVIKLLGQQGQQADVAYSKTGNIIAKLEAGAADASIYQYDTLSRLASAIDSIQGLTKFEYGLQGQLTSLLDAEGGRTSFSHNGFGEKILVRDQVLGDSVLYRDEAGNIVAKGRLNEKPSVVFQYDSLNRIVLVSYSDDALNVAYEYDQSDGMHRSSIGQLTSLFDSAGSHSYKYDDFGRLIRDTYLSNVSGSLNDTVSYKYSKVGQLDKLIYENGALVQYEYDRDRMVSVSYISFVGERYPIIGNVKYRSFSGPIEWRYGNGALYKRSFDIDGRINSISLISENNTSIWSQLYTHDNSNNLSRIDSYVNGEVLNKEYDFDGLHQIKREQVSSGSVSKKGIEYLDVVYEYDKIGNRTSKTVNDLISNYNYGAGSRLLSYGNTKVLQDDRGNAIGLANQSDIEQADIEYSRYLYDHQNRPTALLNNGKLDAIYRYNALGQRVDKLLGQNHISYRYDGQGVLIEESVASRSHIVAEKPKDAKKSQYIWFGKLPIAKIDSDNNETLVRYLHVDHLDTPRVVTDQQSSVIWRWDSDAFGSGAADEDPDKNGVLTSVNLRFPGQYYDSESGLHYNYYRYYEPEIGRYLQSDPLGVLDGPNSYAYVHNNPLVGVDPLGLYDSAIHYYMTYFLAITAGLPQEQARIVSLGAQYVDDNHLTNPIPSGTEWLGGYLYEYFETKEALNSYHFTLDYSNGNGGDSTAQQPGESASSYSRRRFANPTSSQLTNLWEASNNYANVCRFPGGPTAAETRAQLYGEYLHAFEDTFAHRNANNSPLALLNLEGGIGHAFLGHSPDHTYNQYEITDPHYTQPGGKPTWSDPWKYNELRTLEMEKAVFESFKRDFNYQTLFNWSNLAGDGSAKIGVNTGDCNTCWTNGVAPPFEAATGNTGVLQQFNAFIDEGTPEGILAKKGILDKWLDENGFSAIPDYDEAEAEANRARILQDVPPMTGVMLP